MELNRRDFLKGSLAFGGVAALAAAAGVPAFAVAGQVFDGHDQRVPAVSLTERFGEQRARASTLACVEEVTAELLRSCGV